MEDNITNRKIIRAYAPKNEEFKLLNNSAISSALAKDIEYCRDNVSYSFIDSLNDSKWLYISTAILALFECIFNKIIEQYIERQDCQKIAFWICVAISVIWIIINLIKYEKIYNSKQKKTGEAINKIFKHQTKVLPKKIIQAGYGIDANAIEIVDCNRAMPINP